MPRRLAGHGQPPRAHAQGDGPGYRDGPGVAAGPPRPGRTWLIPQRAAGLSAPGSDPPDGAPAAEMLTAIPDTRPDRRPAKPRAAPPRRDQPARPAKYPATGADAREPLPSGAARTMSAMFARTRQDILQPIRLKAQLGTSPHADESNAKLHYSNRSDSVVPVCESSQLQAQLSHGLADGFNSFRSAADRSPCCRNPHIGRRRHRH
jgi:hypothetical protein